MYTSMSYDIESSPLINASSQRSLVMKEVIMKRRLGTKWEVIFRSYIERMQSELGIKFDEAANNLCYLLNDFEDFDK